MGSAHVVWSCKALHLHRSQAFCVGHVTMAQQITVWSKDTQQSAVLRTYFQKTNKQMCFLTRPSSGGGKHSQEKVRKSRQWCAVRDTNCHCVHVTEERRGGKLSQEWLCPRQARMRGIGHTFWVSQCNLGLMAQCQDGRYGTPKEILSFIGRVAANPQFHYHATRQHHR